MTQYAENRYTPEEYFALEEKAQHKSEYYKGRIYAMSGATGNHNEIAAQTISALIVTLAGKGCKVYTSDMGIGAKDDNFYTYADCVVTCQKPEFVNKSNLTLTNPQLIVEVLSPSTRRYDKGDKFELYKNLKSLRHYLLIEKNKIHIDHWYKSGELWILKSFKDINDEIYLETFGLSLRLSLIYDSVDFDNA